MGFCGRVYILKSQNFLILINFVTGDIPFDYLRKNIFFIVYKSLLVYASILMYYTLSAKILSKLCQKLGLLDIYILHPVLSKIRWIQGKKRI